MLVFGSLYFEVAMTWYNPFPKPIENVALNSDRPQRFGLV